MWFRALCGNQCIWKVLLSLLEPESFLYLRLSAVVGYSQVSLPSSSSERFCCSHFPSVGLSGKPVLDAMGGVIYNSSR